MTEALQAPSAAIGPADAPNDASRSSARYGRYVEILTDSLRNQSWFIAIVAIHIVVGYAVTQAYGQQVSLGLYKKVHWILIANFAFVFLLHRVVTRCWTHRPEEPIRFVIDDLKTSYLAPERLLNALPAFVLLPMAFSMVTSMKAMIPLIQPFAWDPAFAELDRLTHGGVDPWELLQPVLGHPLVTTALSHIYALPWFVSVLFIQFCYTFTLHRRRDQFLLSYVLCWMLLGNVMAIAVSSAGPCYYGVFFEGPDPFAPQMSYLSGVAESYTLVSHLAQEFLLENYQEGLLKLGSGISAMPSMHISMAFLMVLGTWHIHWGLRLVTVTYLILLQIGAVHLAWHYAIDGYVAIAGTWLIWWAVGRAFRWRNERTAATGTLPAPAG